MVKKCPKGKMRKGSQCVVKSKKSKGKSFGRLILRMFVAIFITLGIALIVSGFIQFGLFIDIKPIWKIISGAVILVVVLGIFRWVFKLKSLL